MLRFLLYLIIGWGIYYAINGLLASARKSARGRSGEKREGLDDEMVACPECGTYFPSQMGITQRAGGARRLFCSSGCAEAFAQRGGPPGEG